MSDYQYQEEREQWDAIAAQDAAATVTAVVRGARSAEEVARYLPSNYRVLYAVTRDGRLEVVIRGHDSAGWTFDSYVAPRLASGLMFAEKE